MLKDKSSSAILAVSDMDRARAFYRDTLQLELVDEGMEGVLVFRTGATSLVVYASDEAGTNRANAAVWGVGDEIDEIVATLGQRGVRFEHYDDLGDGTTLQGDVHVSGSMRLVWFKDPDGNILHLHNA